MTNLNDCMTRVIRRDIQSMHGYAVQPSAGLVKVDTMENPYRLPEHLQRELGERLGRVAINRYPGSRMADLVAELARFVALPAGCNSLSRCHSISWPSSFSMLSTRAIW